MIRKLSASACVLVAAFAAGCASGGGPAARDCGAAAYQDAFAGGDFYRVEDQSRVSGILRNESDPISAEADRRLINALGADGAAAVKQSFSQCKAQQPAAPAG
jgi:hypothetical protein